MPRPTTTSPRLVQDGPPVDQRTFGELVASALAHLYDWPYLQTHELGHLIVSDPAGELRGQALQRVFLDAIQALKPAPADASDPHAWRTYRYLFLRYVQVMPPAEVAADLGVSERQARRTYREAVDALASVLWDRFRELRADLPSEPVIDRADDQPLARTAPDAGGGAILEQEAQRLATAGHGHSTDVDEVVAGLESLVRAMAHQHRSTWSTMIEPGLPRLSVDRAVLRQVLLNLATLAIEPGNHAIELAGRHADTVVRLTLVSRPATGTPLAPAPAIDANEPRLAVSRHLVESEGGTVEPRTSPDGVLSVEVSFPVANAPTILVIDDNPDVTAVLQRYLETAGFAVRTAASGAEGVELAGEIRPAAITLDVMMASQDGWETLQQLKNDPATHHIPVLICSVLREHELARFLGAADLLPKPVSRPALLRALAHQGLSAPAEADPRTRPGSPSSRRSTGHPPG